MSTSILIKRIFASPIYFLFKHRKKYHDRIRNEYLVLMYHRVVNNSIRNIYMQDGMYVEPDVFGMQIEYLKDMFNIIPLEILLSINNLTNNYDRNKPCCVLTFDDGWIDFYENVYPILKQYNTNATVFLPTGFIGTNKLFWTDKLAYIISEMGPAKYRINFPIPIFLNIMENIHIPIERKIDQIIQIMKEMPVDKIDHILDEMAYKMDIDTDKSRKSFITWEQAKEMHKTGIVSFGSHTKSHQILTTCTDDDIKKELLNSRNMLLENEIISSFIPFAYPNGNYTDKIAAMVEESGYNLAVTTEKGWNPIVGEEKNIYKIKRIGIHQDVSSTKSMLNCRIHGIF